MSETAKTQREEIREALYRAILEQLPGTDEPSELRDLAEAFALASGVPKGGSGKITGF